MSPNARTLEKKALQAYQAIQNKNASQNKATLGGLMAGCAAGGILWFLSHSFIISVIASALITPIWIWISYKNAKIMHPFFYPLGLYIVVGLIVVSAFCTDGNFRKHMKGKRESVPVQTIHSPADATDK